MNEKDLLTQELNQLRKKTVDLEDEIIRLKLELEIRDEMIHAIPNPLFVKNKDFKYINCNDAFAKFIGLPKSEILNSTAHDISPKELADKYHAADCELRDQLGKQEYEYKVKYADGTLHDIIFNKACLLDEENKFSGIVGIMQDITEKKKEEEKIAHFQKAIESSNEAIGISDANWRHSYQNKAFTDLFEYSKDELAECSPIVLYNSPEDAKSLLSQIQAGKSWAKEIEMKSKDGRVFPVSLRADAIFDDKKRIIGLIGIHQDITQKKKSEQELINSEQKYRNIAENLPGIVLRYKLKPDGSDELLYVSKGLEDLYELSLEDALKNNKLIWDRVHKDDLNAYISSVEESAKNLSFWKFEHRIQLPDSRIKWVYMSGVPTKQEDGSIVWDSIGLDITERKRIEQELIEAKEKTEKSEENFKLLNRLTSEMLLLQDTESIYKFIAENLQKHYPNTIVLSNSINESMQQVRLEAISGLDKSLLMKVIKITGFNPIGKNFKLTDIHNSYFKSGKFIEFEGGLAGFSASEFPAFAATAIEKLIGLHKIYTIGINKGDRLLCFIHFFTFNKQVITDGDFIEIFAKQVGLVLQKIFDNEALNKAKEKAEESDRLKSAFLANMSHEIRTPMNGILGFAELLKEPDLNGEKQQEYIEIICRCGNRMLNTVNDIIDISKIEAGLVELVVSEVNIKEQLKYLHTFFKPEAAKNGTQLIFKNDTSVNDFSLKTDLHKFNSIATNLIKNAIKFTNQGTIELGYNIKKENGSKEVEFFIKDTGSGIPKKRQDAIFERFVQADIQDKRALQGSGLGLAISKAYTEMLGGRMWLESEEGKGSTFYFTLPYNSIAEEIKVVGKVNSAQSEKNRNKDLKILIAEDDGTSEMLIKITVEPFAKEILIARNGLDAVETCRKNPDIDLILMDIQLPVMNGYEATRMIREFNSGVFILAQTAFALSGDKEKAIETGCNDYIAKPIKRAELQGLIQKYFRKDLLSEK